MTTKTNVKAGGWSSNHNETMAGKTNVKWERRNNRTETLVTDRRTLKARTRVRAGMSFNYSKLELGHEGFKY